jgi:hypothetical protein
MAEFTKEQRDILIKTAEYMVKRENTSEYSENIRKVAEIALEALNGMGQEPVGYFRLAEDGVSYYLSSPYQQKDGTAPLYAAPQLPQPAVTELEQFAEFMAAESIKYGDYPDGWQCKASNAAYEYAQSCRAAMLQGAEPVHDVDNTNRQFESLGCAEDTSRRFKCTG